MQMHRRRRKFTYLLLIFWSVWAASYAHSRWSSKEENVFPLFAPVEADGGEVEFQFANIPADTYGISLAVGLLGDPRSNVNLPLEYADKLRPTLKEDPIQLSVIITNRRDLEVLRFEGDTSKWNVGTRSNYSPAMKFDNFVVLYDLSETLEFRARAPGEYRVRISLATDNSNLRDHPIRLLITGERVRGYYPVGRMLVLGASFVAMIVLTALVLPFMSRSDRESGTAGDSNG